MSEPNRPSLVVRIPSPIWLIALALAAVGLERLHGTQIFRPHWPAGIAIMVLGVAIALWAVLTFATAGAQIRPDAASNSRLVTHGPFSFTRNPMYLALTTIGVGAAIAVGTLWMWLVPVLLFVLDNFVIIPFEERNIERQFGPEFADYRARVRRWI
jgi:protein-S-isoprenylcysteine O-methyltransferase Ste14